MAVAVKVTVFWVVMPCSLVNVKRRFRGTCCFIRILWPVIEAAGFSAMYTAAELRVSRPRRISIISILFAILSSHAQMSILILYQ
jgi:hypothetical protein